MKGKIYEHGTKTVAFATWGGGSDDLSGYVKNGLYFWLDGIQNTAHGHDATSAKWENLTNSSYDVTYNSAKVIGDKYCIPNGSSSIPSIPSSGTTIEVVMDYIDNGTAQIFMPWYGNYWGTVFAHPDGVLIFNPGSPGVGAPLTSGINTYSAIGSPRAFFVNGNRATSGSATGSWSQRYSRLFYYNSTYPRNCVSKIYAIRIYNRALTDAEILQNAQLDMARFR